jgi:O-antigen ligase
MTSGKIHIPLVLALGLFLPSFIASRQFTDPFMLPKYFYFYLFAVIFFAGFGLRYAVKKYNTRFGMTILDCAVIAYISYQVIHALFTPHIRLLNDTVLLLLISGIVFFFVKPWLTGNAENKATIDVLITGLVLTAFLQACYGLLQYFDVLPRLQEEFRTGGSYGNPGPYTNFLIPLVPFILVSIIYRKEKKGLFFLGIVSLIAVLTVLPVTRARTAWISTGAAGTYIMYLQPVTKKFIRKWMNRLWAKLTAILLSGIFLAAIAVFLVGYKAQSSSGRLFIWKVTVQMIGDKPLFGFGFDKYAVAHNDYQAEYFATHRDAGEEAELADSVSYAFNEYLQITAETGLIGLILFLGLVFFSFFRGKRDEEAERKENSVLIAAKGSLIAILVSSMFSYPLRTVPVYFVLFFDLAVISANYSETVNEIILTEKRRRWLSVIGLIIVVFFSADQYKKYRASKEWLGAFELVRAKEYKKAVPLYGTLYPVLNYNRYFLFNYGAELSVTGDYAKSIELLREAEPRLNDVDLYIYLGNSYAGLGDMNNAVQCFRKASLIVPVKFYPKYRLVKIYLSLDEHEKAFALAREILAMEVKIPSGIVTSIRNEMQELVDRYNDQGNK